MSVDDAAVRHRKTLAEVARETPAKQIGITNNWSHGRRVWHHVDEDGDAVCDGNIDYFRVDAARVWAEKNIDAIECRNCLRPLRGRQPPETYAEKTCRQCGETYRIIAKHLPSCDGAATEVNHVR